MFRRPRGAPRPFAAGSNKRFSVQIRATARPQSGIPKPVSTVRVLLDAGCRCPRAPERAGGLQLSRRVSSRRTAPGSRRVATTPGPAERTTALVASCARAPRSTFGSAWFPPVASELEERGPGSRPPARSLPTGRAPRRSTGGMPVHGWPSIGMIRRCRYISCLRVAPAGVVSRRSLSTMSLMGSATRTRASPAWAATTISVTVRRRRSCCWREPDCPLSPSATSTHKGGGDFISGHGQTSVGCLDEPVSGRVRRAWFATSRGQAGRRRSEHGDLWVAGQ